MPSIVTAYSASIFTYTLPASGSFVVSTGDGVSLISIENVTGSSGDVTITGTKTVNGITGSIVLPAGDSVTISSYSGFQIDGLTIATAASTTAKIVAS